VKLEIMAKNVVVGDVLVKGAHKYTVTNIEQVMSADKIVIFYETLKTKVIRSMKVDASEFVKVEQVEEVSETKADIAKKAAEKFEKDLHYTLELEDFNGTYTLEHLCFIGISWDDRLKFENLEMKTIFIDPKKIISSKRQFEEKAVNEVVAEVNEVAENPVKLVNLYIEHCKEEIETIKTLIVNAVDEDEKLFQKGRMKCKREELTFLENRKSEILSKQEMVSPAEPVTKTPLMAKLIVVGDVISKGRHKYEVTNIKEYGDTITLFYSTIGTKNKIVRFMEVPPTHFITVYENVG
jgi:hypothetical protein